MVFGFWLVGDLVCHINGCMDIRTNVFIDALIGFILFGLSVNLQNFV
jgi:hypothetical protein